MSALASPASLKGVLSAAEAASALARGFRRVGVEAVELPLADGGEGTAEVLGAHVMRVEQVHDAFGRPREAPIRALADGTVVVESAEVIPLDPERLDVRAASSRGLGELLARIGPARVCSCAWAERPRWTPEQACWRRSTICPAPTTVLCDVRATLREAPRLFGPQKGALADDLVELEQRFARLTTRTRSRSCPAAAPRAAWARRSHLSARSSSRERPTCSRRSAFASRPRRPSSS